MSDQASEDRARATFHPPGPVNIAARIPKSNRQYPKSGSELEFWDRCEEATILRGRGRTWREIAERLDTDPSSAMKMVRRYLTAAARFYPAIELRELLAVRYRQEAKKVMREYDLIEYLGDGTEKRLACIARAESLIEKEAKLFGLVAAGAEVNIHVQQPENANPRELPTPADQKRIRQKAKELRAAVYGDAVDASFTTDNEVSPAPEDVVSEGEAKDSP